MMPPAAKVTQAFIRRNPDVGSGLTQVSPVAYWYKYNHFANEDEARGAFKLAYQQGLDGMGQSIQDWMGLTTDQYNAWMSGDTLPVKGKKR